MMKVSDARIQSDLSVTWPKMPRSPAGLTAELQCSWLTAFKRLVKRTIDIAFASSMLLISSPLFLIAAIAIKLDSEGPVIFRQRRSGLNTKQFVIYKFRTMSVLEDGAAITQVRRRDLRVTRAGRLLRRTSVDELPQLLNVLMGEMSLVGPRPHALAHDYEYQTLIANYAHRYSVKPGLTGWSQVNGLRGETVQVKQMAERVKSDLWYVDNWSLSLDLIIILRTCFEVVRDRAY
jgi:putative colanic acid biosynthesis UDP-glucose lipid carrier transferase